MREKISLKYYLISVFIPIIFIVVMFGYATNYINKEISFIEHELAGLKKANEIHSIIINMQRLRGIISMPTYSKKYNLETEQYVYEIKNTINTMIKQLKSTDNNTLNAQSLYKFLSSILQLFEEQHNFTKKEVFYNYSSINEKSFDIQKDISLHSNLMLDPIKEDYLLIETIIIQIPRLIEFNGQLRALSIASSNQKISKDNYIIMTNLISKINELFNELSYNIHILSNMNINNKDVIMQYFNYTAISKDKLSNYIFDNFEEDSKLNNPEIIYEFFTTNINAMIGLYNQVSLVLDANLKQKLRDKTSIRNYIILIGCSCIIFILFNFFNYYRKNNDLIESINHSNKVLKEQSITDGLTQLYNRRYFDIIFEQQLSLSKRHKTSFIFILCDIDHFKKYNDTYGHVLGDETLKKVATALKDSLKRPNDFTFRIGGEEFGVVLSDMTLEKAKGFAKTIKFNVERLNIEHKTNDNNKNLTLSMGIAYVYQSNNIFNMVDIYNNADEALYKSKDNGRNQISTYEFIDNLEENL